MCSLGRPLHLLTFHEPLAHDLMNRRFHKGCTDRVPLAIAFAEVGDERLIVANVGIELHGGAMKFGGGRWVLAWQVEFKPHTVKAVQCHVDVAMPEKMFHPLQSVGSLGASRGMSILMGSRCLV